MKRLLTVALSAILFATLYSCFSYVPSYQQNPNTYYFGFFELFVFVIIYSGPMYFLAGLPLSIYIDSLLKLIEKCWVRYFAGLVLYSYAGTMVGIIFLILFSENVYRLEVITFSIFGFVAANVYFHLSLLISIIDRKYSVFTK